MSCNNFKRYLPLVALTCIGSSPATMAATESARNLLGQLESACDELLQTNGLIASHQVLQKTGKEVSGALCYQYLIAKADIIQATTSDPAARSSAMDAFAANITPDEVPALYTSLVQLGTSQIHEINLHLQNNRSPLSAEGSTTSEANEFGKFTIFATGSRGEGNQNHTDDKVGYDLTNDHYTVGFDVHLSQSWVSGFAYGNNDALLTFSEMGTETENRTDHYMLFSSWERDDFTANVIFGFANGEFETRRSVPGGIAQGNTDHQITYLSLAGSYDFVESSFRNGPHAGFEYLDGKIDSFAETNGNGWNVAFNQQDVRSQVYYMGWHFSYVTSVGQGVLTPYLKADWRTELEDKRDLIIGHFLLDPATPLTVTADNPDADWFQISAGLAAQLPHGSTLFADYETVTGYKDSDLHTVTIGLRFEL